MKHFEEHVEDISLILDEEECSDTKQTDMILDVGDRPPLLQWLFLSFQHVFAMFGATILVPTLTGLPVSVALFASGVGTLIYTFVTKRKVPVYLGSSFAYISAVVIAIKAMGGSVDAAQTGLMLVGVIYVVVALIVRVIGKEWIDKLLPPIVIGPMIAVIGLGLAANAVGNAQFIKDGDPRAMIVAIVTFLIAALISTKAKGFFKIIPFLIAILGGYVLSLCLGLVDFQAVVDAKWLSFPDFILPFKVGNFRTYNLYFGPETLAILPVALVTITTYGENTGVIGMTKISSVYVTGGAACIAILLSCVGKISAFISTIPACVLGGMSILLYGVIASNGLRVLVDNKIDFGKQRNLVIASAMLVIGLGGAILPVGSFMTLSGTALSALVGIILNLILPKAS